MRSSSSGDVIVVASGLEGVFPCRSSFQQSETESSCSMVLAMAANSKQVLVRDFIVENEVSLFIFLQLLKLRHHTRDLPKAAQRSCFTT